nr:NADP(+)-dependent isocitrate dehydrogenase, NADP(+)-dependent IDH {peak IX} {EC 1.1.1.42} [rats, ovary, Peptide Partial, 20 aa] [Rattus sp.]
VTYLVHDFEGGVAMGMYNQD